MREKRFAKEQIIGALNKAGAGLSKIIMVGNGQEFSRKVIDEWAYRASVKIFFIRPEKPVDNNYNGTFNKRFRHECLNLHWFMNIEHAQASCCRMESGL